MAKVLQLRRGTTTEHASFTGKVGEVTVDTTKHTVVIHDGATTGGYPVALEKNAVTSEGINALISSWGGTPVTE